jgi:hypothetical protein
MQDHSEIPGDSEATLECRMHGAGPTTMLAWRAAGSQVEAAAHPEVCHPLIPRLMSDPQACGHLGDGFPLVKPPQGLGTTEEMGIGGLSRERFQGVPRFEAECHQRQQLTSCVARETMTHYS